MGHGRRQILWFGVTSHPTAEWIANQLTEACGWVTDQIAGSLLPLATAAFSGHSRFGGMVGSSQLASAEDARDTRRDPLRPELATCLLSRRFAGFRLPHGATRHFERDCDADGVECWWHHSDDRERNAAEPDQFQTQAAAGKKQLAPNRKQLGDNNDVSIRSPIMSVWGVRREKAARSTGPLILV